MYEGLVLLCSVYFLIYLSFNFVTGFGCSSQICLATTCPDTRCAFATWNDSINNIFMPRNSSAWVMELLQVIYPFHMWGLVTSKTCVEMHWFGVILWNFISSFLFLFPPDERLKKIAFIELETLAMCWRKKQKSRGFQSKNHISNSCIACLHTKGSSFWSGWRTSTWIMLGNSEHSSRCHSLSLTVRTRMIMMRTERVKRTSNICDPRLRLMYQQSCF